MSKLKVYISSSGDNQKRQRALEKNINDSNYQHEYNADLINKNITNTIKKFSSERSLFFSNLNDAIIDCNSKWMGEEQTIRFRNESSSNKPPTAETESVGAVENPPTLRRHGPSNASCKVPNSRASLAAEGGGGGGGVGRSGKGWREALLRRCKSTKDLFQTGFMGSHNSAGGQGGRSKTYNEEKKASFRKTDNLDEFDKHYLSSGNRKNIVKELRKNFEGNSTQTPNFVEAIHSHDTKSTKNNKVNVASGEGSVDPVVGAAEVTRKARRFFEIFSSGKNQNLKSKQIEMLKKNKNKENKGTCSGMTESSTQTLEDDLMEPFYLHDKYGVNSRRNLNQVFYGAIVDSDSEAKENVNANQNSVAVVQKKPPPPPPPSVNSQNSLLRSKVMEKYGDRVRESESFSKFLSHANDSTPKLKAVNKIDPDLLHKPRNNTLNLYGPRRNSTSNLDDLQRCDMVIENDFESMPPPLNPSFQQQYLEATKKQQQNLIGQSISAANKKPLQPEKNHKNYAEKLLVTSDHLRPPIKVNNIEEDLRGLSSTRGRKFTHIKSDSANNVSDFDVEFRTELEDFVDPKWCSSTSINSGFGHATFYRQFGRIRKVTHSH